MPSVTVIIPTYNYARYIAEAVHSVLSQATSVLYIELIVIDDGSTDNTQAILQPLIDAQKIRYVYQKNEGKAAATRKGIELATGTYIFNLDADDYFLPQKIVHFVAVFESSPRVVHVGSVAKMIDGNGKHIATETVTAPFANQTANGIDLATYFLKNNTLWAGGSTYAARADVLKKLPLPKEVDMYLDEYLILGILAKGDSFCFDTPLSIWRVHGNNYSNTRPEQQREKDHRSLASSLGTLDALRKYSDLPPYLLELYAFKHETRRVAMLESDNRKSLGEIWRYGRQMLQLRQQGLAFFKRYTSFNRLLPTFFLRLAYRFLRTS